MSKLRLIIAESQITEQGEFLIKKFSIIDGNTGEEIRIAKVTPELKILLDSCEIDIENFLKFLTLAQKNTAIKKLVNEFNLVIK